MKLFESRGTAHHPHFLPCEVPGSDVAASSLCGNTWRWPLCSSGHLPAPHPHLIQLPSSRQQDSGAPLTAQNGCAPGPAPRLGTQGPENREPVVGGCRAADAAWAPWQTRPSSWVGTCTQVWKRCLGATRCSSKGGLRRKPRCPQTTQARGFQLQPTPWVGGPHLGLLGGLGCVPVDPRVGLLQL